jgi:hypothetical protein
MLWLLGKTIFDGSAFSKMFPRTKVQSRPLDDVGSTQRFHESHTIGFRVPVELEIILLNAGFGRITMHDGFAVISGNIVEWELIAEYLTNHEDRAAKALGSTLVMSFPDIFKNSKTKSQPDGNIKLLRS